MRIYLFESISGWYTGHFWSLCIEEHFYVILSSFFAIFGRVKVIIPIVLFLLSISIWSAWSFRHKGDPQIDTLIHFFKVFKYMDYMLWGCIFAGIRFYYQNVITYLKILQIPSFLLLFVIIIFDFKGKTFIAPFLFGFTIFLTSTNPNTLIKKVLEARVLNFIGKISYSLYLWQQLFFYKPGSEFITLKFLQDPPISICCIFAMALFSYHKIEKPFIKFGHSYASRRI
jgi:peptidoglycan/LPS O-acetylase OafA/YrhL